MIGLFVAALVNIMGLGAMGWQPIAFDAPVPAQCRTFHAYSADYCRQWAHIHRRHRGDTVPARAGFPPEEGATP